MSEFTIKDVEHAKKLWNEAYGTFAPFPRDPERCERFHCYMRNYAPQLLSALTKALEQKDA